jgi:hypothetical protein
MKINKYLAYSFLLAGGLLVSCDDYQNSIDDYPLNYEIPSVAPNPSTPVGAYLVDPPTNDNVFWERLTAPFNDGPASQGGGKIGPYLMPTQGRYRFNAADSTNARVYANIVRWSKQAGIDFLITPLRSHRWDEYPKNLNSGDTLLIGLISGRNDSLGYANRGEIKYAISYDLGNFSGTGMGPTSLTNDNLLETTQAEYVNSNGTVKTDTAGLRDNTYARITREERLYRAFERMSVYFNDPTYQTTSDGRPVLLLEGAKSLYTSDSKRVYDNIRDTIFKYCGKHVYLVARQDPWTPTARFEYFFVKGEVDAITPNRMTDAGNWNRVYMLNVLIDQHMKANKDYISRSQHPNIDYIPSISPSFSGYLDNGDVQRPIVPKNEKDFRERCNIAKINVGRMPMIIVDSFNNWKNETQIEPSDPDYGNGYGTFYLDILRSELKGR